MSLTTKSIFYFGIEVTSTNKNINFNEGSGELTATLPIGGFSHTDFAQKIEDALNSAGTRTYDVTFNRDGRTYTISADGTFDLLIATGSQSATSAFSLMGFTGGDVTGLTTYTGGASGSEYKPQSLLQNYLAKEDNQQFIDPKVNKAASGAVETIRFGIVSMIRMNIQWITNRDMSKANYIENNATGVSDANTFMRDIIKKGPFEFMPDRASRSTFSKVLLESTPESKDGISYELKEGMSSGLEGYFETGNLMLRVLT